MEFIEEVVAGFEGRRFTALDVGTGSGILAIAIARLGAKRVWAIDTDPIALKVAEENLRANGAFDNVRLSDVKLCVIRKKFSLVVANLTAETIAELAGALKSRVVPAGFLILAGILQWQASSIARRFQDQFRLVGRKRSGEWTSLLLRKKGRSREKI